ncbi:(d)CMP kinase [Algicella marina]|uniref:Cytidylate kinase n=1 Tax=Algicella marina TaxID=2683284 RepID=A0A6P1T2E3_9RHOB|nr:(d)CMP kinase [Algicella marina]QHQ36167.1 (d)CMP kinase [Algicella marina]
MQFTVALDGPAAAGKGTIARELAKQFKFAHLDTGMLYRAVGLKTLEQGHGIIDPARAAAVAGKLQDHDIQRFDLRSAMASRAASKVAVLPEVRKALLDFQRVFAKREGGAVLDGRDIGTVICPDAEVKFYVTASDEVRAMRRFKELEKQGAETSLEAVLMDLQIRDARDSGRSTAPLTQADDAVLLDTTDLSIDAAVEQAAMLINKKMG